MEETREAFDLEAEGLNVFQVLLIRGASPTARTGGGRPLLHGGQPKATGHALPVNFTSS